MWSFTRFISLYTLLYTALYGTAAARLLPNVSPDNTRSSYETVHPPRDAKFQTDMYPDRLDVLVSFSNRTMPLRLKKNVELLAHGYKEIHFENGRKVVNTPSISINDFCYYDGTVDGDKESHAAINLCNEAISGTVYLEGLRYEVSPNNSTSQLLYLTPASANNDLTNANYTCGHAPKSNLPERKARVKRGMQMPEYYKKYINWKDLYVEMVIVFDNSVYRTSGGNKNTLFNRAKELANYVNSYYQPVNIKVALVGVEIWSDSDRITVSESGDASLDQFLRYRRAQLLRDMPNDHAQLITTTHFTGGVVGKAMKGTMCALDLSGAVVTDHSRHASTVAATMAHEMGHNFGMDHDNDTCQCPHDRCLMAASSTSAANMYWSSCSMEYLSWSISHGSDFCLKNKPSQLFDAKTPICGNGFVEAGEQCDCGLPELCDNPCCNASTCQLAAGAVCASGGCCDTAKCQFKPMAAVCREGRDECDLAEYCSGKSEVCPDETYKQNGIACGGGQAYCYDGFCKSHDSQCKLIWGTTGKSAGSECYALNARGDMQGNCGFKRLEGTFTRCTDDDLMCGSLQCSQRTEKTQYGDRSLVRMAYTEIRYSDKTSVCYTVSIDLGSEENDPGLVPSGAKCGNDKMCKGRKCVPVNQILAEKPCATDCRANGVCNNLGHCHCHVGFGGSDCGGVGLGGSIDSGPASTGETTATQGPIRNSTASLNPVQNNSTPLLSTSTVTVPTKLVPLVPKATPKPGLNGSLGFPGNSSSEADSETCILFEACSAFNIGLGVLIFVVVILPLLSALLVYLYKKGKIRPPKIVKVFDKPAAKPPRNKPQVASKTIVKPAISTAVTKSGTTIAKPAPSKPTSTLPVWPAATSPKHTTPALPVWPPAQPCAFTNESKSFPKPAVAVSLHDGLLPVLAAIAASNVSLHGSATNQPAVNTTGPNRPRRPTDETLAKLQLIDEVANQSNQDAVNDDDVILPSRPAPPPPPPAKTEESGISRGTISATPTTGLRKLSDPASRKLALANGKNQQSATETPSHVEPSRPTPRPVGQTAKPLLPLLPPAKSKPEAAATLSPTKHEHIPPYALVDKKPKPSVLPPPKPALVHEKPAALAAPVTSSQPSDVYYDVLHSKVDSPKKEEANRKTPLKPVAQFSGEKKPVNAQNPKPQESAKPSIGPVKSAFVTDLEKKLKSESSGTASTQPASLGKKALVPPPVQKRPVVPNKEPASKDAGGKADNRLVSQLAARFEKSQN